MTRALFALVIASALLGGCGGPPEEYRQAMLRVQEGAVDDATLARFLKLARAGHIPSQFQLAMIEAGRRGTEGDAMQWLQRAAAAGHVGARYQLAVAYRDGQGMAKSPGLAEKWFGGLARDGFAPAQFELARLLEDRGAGAEARPWYERAADGGLEAASQRMAAACQRGELGLQPDAACAAAWRDRLKHKPF